MLPYSIEVLFAVFGQFNREAWPVQLILFALALGIMVLLVRMPDSPGAARAISVSMAAAWAWVGIGFHYLYFAPLNFAAPFYAAIFVLQALLLVWAGGREKPRYRWHNGVSEWAGLALLLYALGIFPLIDWWLGHAWSDLRLFAMAPGPTALFTLGLLLLTAGPTPYYLLVIPVLWGVMQGVQAWWLGLPQDMVLPFASLLGVGLVVWKHRQAPCRERG